MSIKTGACFFQVGNIVRLKSLGLLLHMASEQSFQGHGDENWARGTRNNAGGNDHLQPAHRLSRPLSHSRRGAIMNQLTSIPKVKSNIQLH